MDDKTKNKAIETYAEDLEGALDSNEEGLVRKLIHEQEELDSETRKNSPEAKQNRTFLILGLSLLAFGIAAMVFFFTQREKASVVEISPQYKPIIFIEKTEFKDVTGLSKEDVAKTIYSRSNITDVKTGSIEGLYLTENKQIIGLRRVLNLLGSGFYPEDAYVNNNFLMGTMYGEDNDFFAILEVSAFVDIFDSVRIWEKTMFKDLHGTLGVVVNAENNYLLNKSFDDGVLENKNSRILHDNEGNIVLMYIFAKDNYVVITEGEKTAQELILRLSSAKVEK
ncbi:MAG: hypothetical protein KBC44_02230 [Candidatus Pacebacteria bacterium]|nr:hypothetical protein [Candidatus Paceibacterota bacterium]MBP9839775.1 hypothetical protein [Candidatus Paceibacterota bacterium]MDQ5922354.1 hypothetical protein [Patescibacteria group bacterium]